MNFAQEDIIDAFCVRKHAEKLYLTFITRVKIFLQKKIQYLFEAREARKGGSLDGHIFML
jgi:hypothetical protein